MHAKNIFLKNQTIRIYLNISQRDRSLIADKIPHPLIINIVRKNSNYKERLLRKEQLIIMAQNLE